MDSVRWKAMVALSSDHAGVNAILEHLERTLLRGLARCRDARQARDFIQYVAGASEHWCETNDIDQRPWTDIARYRKG